MPAFHHLDDTFPKPLHHGRHHAKFSTQNAPSSFLNQHEGTDGTILSQLRGLFPRAKMVKFDSQAGVYGQSLSDLPGRRFLVPPWLALLAWIVILIFIGLTIAGFILAYQARKEFRMRVEEQRKLLEKQASDDELKVPISRKEFKSFTRKSIMVLNPSSQQNTPPYRVSIAGQLTPRNVFDRPTRDSILVAQITPQSDSFSHDPYHEFSRQSSRESFWDPAFRKSIMSVASVSSMMTKIQKRTSATFAMIEQLDEQALQETRPQRQHHFRQGSNLRVQDHQAQTRRFVPTAPSRLSQSITFTESIEPVASYPRIASPPPAADGSSETRKPFVAPELAQLTSDSNAPISADEALAQYAASRTTTPAPSQNSRSNSLLKMVRRSLTSQQSSAAVSQLLDPLTPKNHGDAPVMQSMNSYTVDSAPTLSDSLLSHATFHLQPSPFTHSIIFEEQEDYFNARRQKNSAMLMNSGVNNVHPMSNPLPRRLPQAVINSDESAMVSPAPSSTACSQSSNIRPRLNKLTTCVGVESTMSHSNSDSPSSNPYGRRNNKIELPASPRDGMSSPGSTTATYTSFSSLVLHPTTISPDSSFEGCPPDKENDSHRSDLNSTPSLTLKRLPSLSTNPYARRKRQSTSQSNPRDELRMVQLKNRHENLQRNLSNPTQAHTVERSSPPPPNLTRANPVRRTASAQTRLPLGGTMSSGGVRDSSFIP